MLLHQWFSGFLEKGSMPSLKIPYLKQSAHNVLTISIGNRMDLRAIKESLYE